MMKTMRVTDLRLSTLSIAGVLAGALLLPASAALGASLSVSSSTVQESGDTARVCVGLSAGGEEVAATQNDLVWDANCASLIDKCEASSGHGKQLMSNQRSTNELRAIVISLQDTKPIPPNAELYCCTFRVDLESGCCAIGLQGMSASDPEGRALGLAGRGGQVCVASGRATGGGLQDGTGGRQQQPLSADLGSGAQQEAAPAAGQPQAQAGAPQAAGSGNAVLSGGTGGVPGGVGGVPGGGGAPGGQPGAPAQPGQVQQPQAAAPADVAPEGGRPQQAQVPGTQQEPVAGEGTPTVVPAAATARPTSAPAAAQPAAPAAKPATAPARTTAKAAAPAPAAAPKSSGCNCEISPSGVGFEASGALVAIGLLLWARRRRL